MQDINISGATPTRLSNAPNWLQYSNMLPTYMYVVSDIAVNTSRIAVINFIFILPFALRKRHKHLVLIVFSFYGFYYIQFNPARVLLEMAHINKYM